jgi:hypothetical protein
MTDFCMPLPQSLQANAGIVQFVTLIWRLARNWRGRRRSIMPITGNLQLYVGILP